MTLEHHKRAIGIFSSRQDAEVALQELKDSEFPMDKVSIIARNIEQQEEKVVADTGDSNDKNTDRGAVAGTVAGGVLGGFSGLLAGLVTLAIPGIGPIVLAGAGVATLVSTLAGGAIGAATGNLIAGLMSLEISEEQAKVYSERVSRGEYLVIVDGTEAEIRRAEGILSSRGIQEWGIYNVPKVNTVSGA